jgi:alkenylglycerophosphocholine/alkenylglycerophosphoethanolamine hydrolase
VVPVLGVAAALAYLAVFPTAPLWASALIKPLPVLSLAMWCGPGRGQVRARLVSLGLVAAAAGDVLLVFPALFLPGVAAFLAAHLFYTAAFLTETRRGRLLRAVPFALWGAGGYALLAPVLGTLVWPVALYVFVICVMMWRAAACVGHTGVARPEELWAATGAVLFGMSDTLLALHRFLTPWPDAPYLVMVLYWSGQIGIARWARPATGISTGFRYHRAGSPAA